MEANIEEFLSWAPHAGRATAEFFLRAKNNDIQVAIRAFYDGENPPRYEAKDNYDESAFAADRDGGDVQMGETRAFEMDASDHINPRLLLSAPTPSRSNSRMSSRRISTTDLTAAYNGDTSGEDPIEIAMRQSRQETGVTDVLGPYYGPAPRIESENVIPDPADPKERRREPETPVFLKPLAGNSTNDHLPSVLTILAAVPLAWEALLCRKMLLGDYGDSDGWWSGAAVPVGKVVDLRDDDPYSTTVEVAHELQRLVAFLQRSHRSYGSAQALTDMQALWEVGVGEESDDNLTVRVLRAWETAVRSVDARNGLAKTFTTKFVSSTDSEVQVATERYWIDLTMRSGLWDQMSTLYDAIDARLWWGDHDGEAESHGCIGEPGEVVLLHIPFRYPDVEIDVPPVLYLDRYLDENAEMMRRMRRELAASYATVERIETRLGELEAVAVKMGGKTVKSTNLLRSTIRHFEDAAEHNEDADRTPWSSDPDVPLRSANGESQYILDHLKAISEQVDRKMKSLQREKQRLSTQMQETASLLTKPVTSPDQPSPRHRRMLRGAVTKPNVTYVLYPQSGGDVDDMDDMDDVDEEELRWWRIEYPLVDNSLSMKTLVSEADVLAAVKHEGPSVTLVYASDDAVKPRPLHLPAQLERFVERDNQAFAAELHEDGVLNLKEEEEGGGGLRDVEMLPDYGDSQGVVGLGGGRGRTGWDERIPASVGEEGKGEAARVRLEDEGSVVGMEDVRLDGDEGEGGVEGDEKDKGLEMVERRWGGV